jgi:predicted HAD superfamily Cof-like phosphohydrolase
VKSIDQVREFHAAMGVPIGDTGAPTFGRIPLRLDLIAEEFRELCEACGYELEYSICPPLVEKLHPNGTRYFVGEAGPVDVVEAADALADLRYVTEGAAVEWGLPLDAVTDEVHRSNMAKVGGPVRADGKILKPAGWTPPDVAGVLARFRK